MGGGTARCVNRQARDRCGGDQDVFEKWYPVPATIGDQACYIGPIGAGSVAKLVHNCYGYIATAAAPKCSAWE